MGIRKDILTQKVNGYGPSISVILPPLSNPLGFARFSGVKCKTLLNVKTYFVRITLGLSEASARGLDVGARRVRVKVRPKSASEEATTV